jgi:hypothetical protein
MVENLPLIFTYQYRALAHWVSNDYTIEYELFVNLTLLVLDDPDIAIPVSLVSYAACHEDTTLLEVLLKDPRVTVPNVRVEVNSLTPLECGLQYMLIRTVELLLANPRIEINSLVMSAIIVRYYGLGREVKDKQQKIVSRIMDDLRTVRWIEGATKRELESLQSMVTKLDMAEKYQALFPKA